MDQCPVKKRIPGFLVVDNLIKIQILPDLNFYTVETMIEKPNKITCQN